MSANKSRAAQRAAPRATPRTVQRAAPRTRGFLARGSLASGSLARADVAARQPASAPALLHFARAPVLFGPVLFVAVLCAAVLLAGCASKPPAMPPDLLTVTGSGADLYLVLPFAGNEMLVRSVASSVALSTALSGQAPGSLPESFFDRAEVLYAAVYPDRISLVITGNFPKSASSFVFPASAGWKKKTAKPYGSWYERGNLSAAIPAKGIVLASVSRNTADDRAIHSMLAALANPETAPFESRISPAFRSYSHNAASDGRVGLLVLNPAAMETALFGSLLEMPVERIELFAVTADDAATTGADPADVVGAAATGADPAAGAPLYLVSARIVLSDERTVRAFSILLKLALGTAVQTDGASLV
ncbi:MAG TPA: hypothetical protein PK408_06295, partial [Treponemataceae bacterium]|nr:hypothetical protein [Treponemataceae bacterium]